MNAINRDFSRWFDHVLPYLPNRPLLEVVLAVVGSVATCRRPSCGRRCFAAAAKLVKADPFSTKKAERVRTEASRLEDEVNFMFLSLEICTLREKSVLSMMSDFQFFRLSSLFSLFFCVGAARALLLFLWWEIFLLWQKFRFQIPDSGFRVIRYLFAFSQKESEKALSHHPLGICHMAHLYLYVAQCFFLSPSVGVKGMIVSYRTIIAEL